MKLVDETLMHQSGVKIEDHRVRVAAERRQRMRARLQSAIIECYASNSNLQLPSVEEVCGKAGVSRATFYAHFDSVQDAADAIGQSLLEEMFNSTVAILGREHTPSERIALGVQMFLMRSATDSAWASFVTRAIFIGQDTNFIRGIATDIEDFSREQGAHVVNVDAARSLILGAVMEGIRHVHQTGDRRRQYVEDLTAMILCALGVQVEKAVELVRKTSVHIRGLALDRVDWWRDPWK